MKKTALIIFICSLLFAACDNGLESLRKDSAPEDGFGRVAVTISGAAARTVFPALPSAKYEYRFARVIGGEAGEWGALEPENGYFTLEPGEWQVNVLVYANVSDAVHAASGTSAAFTVSAGETAQVTVQLAGNVEAGSEGTFSWYIKYPADAEVTVFSLENLLDDEADTIDLTPVSGTVDGGDSSVLVLSGTYSENVPAGYYYLTVRLERDAATAGANEVVYVYDKLDSAYGTAENPIIFTEDNFSVHVWGGWTITTEPTCLEAGVETRVCTVCGETDTVTQSVDALGHDWREWDVTTPATCMATGTGSRTCNNCGLEETVIPINPNAHQLDPNYIQTQPTCTTAGSGAVVCLLNAEHSNSTALVVIPALGHLYHWTETTAPTCVAAGVETGTCTRDHTHTATRTGAAINPDAHVWNTVITTITAATATTDGEEGYVCNLDNSHTRDTSTLYATGTSGLSFTLISDNTAYRVSRGTATGNIFIPAYRRPNASSAYLPVTEIADTAYINNNTTITRVTIPASVTSIGREFSECTNLTGVTFAAGSQLQTIGNYAFRYCGRLTDITIPEGVTSIGDMAFYDCISFTGITIPASVTSIGGEAFSNNLGVTSSFASITVDADNPNYASHDGILYNKEKTSFVQIPQGISGNVTIPDSVTSIPSAAFRGCTNLTGLTIPEGITEITYYVFDNCTGLTSLTIPASVTYISFPVFAASRSLTSITIDGSNPNFAAEGGILYNKAKTSLLAYPSASGNASLPAGITSIGNDAFSDNTRLTGITIPAGVTSIGGSAFYRCSGLTSVTIPASVTYIGYRAFMGCTGLTGITIPAGVTSIDQEAFRNCTSLTVVTFEGTIASGSFSTTYTFPGDLRTKFYAEDSANGVPGTYTATGSGDSKVWTKLSGVDNITAPVWIDGKPISLAVPPVALPSGGTVTAQGWQISDNGSNDWADFTPPSTAEMSYNGKYLRYYATSSDGQTYYSNTVQITVSREVTIAMWDSGGDGWDGSGALRIVKNGTQLATGVKVQTTTASNTPSGQRSNNTYTFNANSGDVVQIYWVAGTYQSENSFIVYYTDLPPNPAFTSSNNNSWSGSNALVYKLRGTMNSIAGGELLGSFTVP